MERIVFKLRTKSLTQQTNVTKGSQTLHQQRKSLKVSSKQLFIPSNAFFQKDMLSTSWASLCLINDHDFNWLKFRLFRCGWSFIYEKSETNFLTFSYVRTTVWVRAAVTQNQWKLSPAIFFLCNFCDSLKKNPSDFKHEWEQNWRKMNMNSPNGFLSTGSPAGVEATIIPRQQQVYLVCSAPSSINP